jgi:hypothetical protein
MIPHVKCVQKIIFHKMAGASTANPIINQTVCSVVGQKIFVQFVQMDIFHQGQDVRIAVTNLTVMFAAQT